MSFNPYFFDSQSFPSQIPSTQAASQFTQLTQTQTVCGTQSQFVAVDDAGVYHFLEAIFESLPSADELQALELRFSGEKVHILVKIRDAIFGLIEQFPNRILKMFTLETNVLLTETRTRKSKGNPRYEKRFLRSRATNLKMLAVRLRLLEMVFNLVFTGSFATKRDLFYKHKDLFGTQNTVDKVMTEICGFLGYDRHDLNVSCCSKGSLIGPIRVTTRGGQVDCGITPISITSQFLDAEIQTDAKYVIVVEKDTIFQRLIDLEFRTLFSDAILITGRGFPDIATRKFMKVLQVQFGIPFFGLMDYDPHGLHIFLTYKYGSSKQASEVESGGALAKVESFEYIGLKSVHVPIYCSSVVGTPFTEADDTTSNVVARRAKQMRDSVILDEINAMKKTKKKVELEAIAAHSAQYLLQFLFDCQQQMPWILVTGGITKSTPMLRKNTDNHFLSTSFD